VTKEKKKKKKKKGLESNARKKNKQHMGQPKRTSGKMGRIGTMGRRGRRLAPGEEEWRKNEQGVIAAQAEKTGSGVTKNPRTKDQRHGTLHRVKHRSWEATSRGPFKNGVLKKKGGVGVMGVKKTCQKVKATGKNDRKRATCKLLVPGKKKARLGQKHRKTQSALQEHDARFRAWNGLSKMRGTQPKNNGGIRNVLNWGEERDKTSQNRKTASSERTKTTSTGAGSSEHRGT